MCRIAGYWSFNANRYAEDVIQSMCDVLQHGGPDDSGIYKNDDDGVYLAHRRLSIIDLSSSGHQPMQWKNLTLVFNGELYNYGEVRKELLQKGYEFSGHSDTEVLLKSFNEWGIKCIDRFVGMFAFAIWDNKEKKMYLCRDRVGVKPLYVYHKNGVLVFASELRSIYQHPAFNDSINPDSIAYYLRYGYISSPKSIFSHIEKLKQGTWLIIDRKEDREIVTYWNAEDIYKRSNCNANNEGEFMERCETLLKESCKLRMVADVDVGVFLSGGIDSSLVTALLQTSSSKKIKTFTIGFEDRDYDESPYARKIANFFETEHYEYICNKKDFFEGAELVSEHFDEPFGDSSCIPTFLVAKKARQQVKVALSADGGDEVFSGYIKYVYAKDKFQKLKKIHPVLRKSLAGSLNNTYVLKGLNGVNSFARIKYFNSRIQKFSEAITTSTETEFLATASAFSRYSSLAEIGVNKRIKYSEGESFLCDPNKVYGQFTVLDLNAFLEGDILTKVDRTSMHVALEAREPLLDHRLIELMLSAPDNLKIRNGQTKFISRAILKKYLPIEFFERPKQGFAIPINVWLKNDLKDDLNRMASDRSFADCFRLNQKGINQIVKNYLRGDMSVDYYLPWFLLMLHKWYYKWYN